MPWSRGWGVSFSLASPFSSPPAWFCPPLQVGTRSVPPTGVEAAGSDPCASPLELVGPLLRGAPRPSGMQPSEAWGSASVAAFWGRNQRYRASPMALPPSLISEPRVPVGPTRRLSSAPTHSFVGPAWLPSCLSVHPSVCGRQPPPCRTGRIAGSRPHTHTSRCLTLLGPALAQGAVSAPSQPSPSGSAPSSQPSIARTPPGCSAPLAGVAKGLFLLPRRRR